MVDHRPKPSDDIVSGKHSIYHNLAMISQLGLSILVPILLCIGVGVFLDSRFGTKLLFPMLVLGFLAGGRNGYMLAMSMIREDKKEDETGD